MVRRKVSILHIDDDQDDLFLFNRAVQGAAVDVSVEVAVSGELALRQLGAAEELPDLLLVDIRMPMMSGLEFLEEAKKKSRGREIPVVMFTTSAH